MYKRLVNEIRKEKLKEIKRIQIEEESAKICKYFYRELENYGLKPHLDSSSVVKEIEWLKLIALGKALPSCNHCSWFRNYKVLREQRKPPPRTFHSHTCHHPKAVKKKCSLKNPRRKLSELDVKFSQKDIPEIRKKLCPYFEPSYKLKVVGLREAQKEILEKLKREVIVAGGWAREIILDIPRYHKDIDILVEESNWSKVRQIFKNEWFEIEEIRPEKLKVIRAMVTIDIALFENQGEFYILPIYDNNSHYCGSFQLPKEGFEKRKGFTVMSLELQWLTLSPERRTKKAKKFAKLLKQQKIKQLATKLSFVAE